MLDDLVRTRTADGAMVHGALAEPPTAVGAIDVIHPCNPDQPTPAALGWFDRNRAFGTEPAGAYDDPRTPRR